MVVCPYCGKENNQPDAAYCLYCGSRLGQPQAQTLAGASRPYAGQGFGTPGGMSDRYMQALARVELLGNIVVALAVIALILLFV